MTRSRCARPRGLAALLIVGVALPIGEPPLHDAPVEWHEDDRRDISPPAPRDVNLTRDALETTLFEPIGRLFHPGRFVRRVGRLFGGDHVPPAANINPLDEALNSAWFTNRIGLFPLTSEEAARGPLTGAGPHPDGVWTVVDAKTTGVTPGFTIRDSRGTAFVIKFDPPEYPGMTIAASVVSGRILHAAGYNVPEEVIVSFRRDRLVVGPNVRFRTPGGQERALTATDLDSILGRVHRFPDGTWHALASKYLAGTPLGPFAWRGRRKDDPNDRVNHQNRRELRGLRMFAAWLCHFDTKQDNTLDMLVETDGRRFVRHYLIDFASTLGAGALGLLPTACHEYSVDPLMIVGRSLALGLWEDPWRRIQRPAGLDEVGLLESESFHPMAFKPTKPNAAFANMTDRDGYWAAKIISAFTDRHLEAIVAEARYRNPEAARWVARILGERRDQIARYFFDRVPPLDFVTVERGVLRFHDLGIERTIHPPASAHYRARAAAATAERQHGPWTAWTRLTEPRFPLDAVVADPAVQGRDVDRHPFLAVDLQVHRGDRWSPSVRVYLTRVSERVVALER